MILGVSSDDRSAALFLGIGLYKPWIDILLEGQEKTWLAGARPPGIQIIHVHARKLNNFGLKLDELHESIRFKNRIIGRLQSILDLIILFPFRNVIPTWKESRELEVRDPVIEIQSPDAYLFLKWKGLGVFDYFYNFTKHNFLVISTTSSFINLSNLQIHLSNLPSHGVYAGPLPFPGAEFVSGSFRIFSRDVVKIILDDPKSWVTWKLEDVALGAILKRQGVDPIFMNTNNFASEQEILSSDWEYLRNQIHFRLKSGSHEQRNDVQLMRVLSAKLAREE